MGAIGTSTTRQYLGARPVSVSTIPIEGKMSLLLLSSRPWISRSSSSGGGVEVLVIRMVRVESISWHRCLIHPWIMDVHLVVNRCWKVWWQHQGIPDGGSCRSIPRDYPMIVMVMKPLIPIRYHCDTLLVK